MMADMVECVERFSREIRNVEPPETPQRLGMQGKINALDFLREELTEFEDSVTMEKEADALVDLAYVAFGRLVEMGLSPRALFEEVHAANMRKAAGDLAKRPGWDGTDAVKPDGWTPPNLLPLLSAGRESLLRGLWRPKILVIGHAGHGKDTFCQVLRRYGFRFESSSRHCAERIVMPYFDSLGQSYESVHECLADRANHRQLWYNLIREFNSPDATALARSILEDNDVYCGMRSADELITCRQSKLFDSIIWVDRSRHLPPEPATSCTVMKEMAHCVVDNNGTRAQLTGQIHNYVVGLYGRHAVASAMREAADGQGAVAEHMMEEAA